MNLDITTPGKQLFSGEVSLVQMPGIDGLFEILENHAPMVAALREGRIKATLADGKTEFFDIKGGTAEVHHNQIQVLAE